MNNAPHQFDELLDISIVTIDHENEIYKTIDSFSTQSPADLLKYLQDTEIKLTQYEADETFFEEATKEAIFNNQFKMQETGMIFFDLNNIGVNGRVFITHQGPIHQYMVQRFFPAHYEHKN